ncbi:WD repeat domain-containing protein, partial [Tetrabaena socialis]
MVWDTSASPTASGAAAAAAGRCTAVLRQTEWMTAVAFSPDGHTLASGSVAKELRIWDVAACEAEHAAAVGGSGGTAAIVLSAAAAHTADVTCVAVSPDGGLLATASEDKTVIVWQVGGGDAGLRWRATLEGHFKCVTGVAWAPPGPPGAPPRLASVSDDLTVRIWELLPATPSALALMPNGDNGNNGNNGNGGGGGGGGGTTRRASSGGAPALLARCVATLVGHTDRIRGVAWSPDTAGGGALASGAEDNHVRLWDARSGTCTATLWGHSNYVTCVSYSPADGGSSVTSAAQDHTIRVWDTASHKCVRTLQGHDHYVNALSYSPCGGLLASASCDKSVRLWDHDTGMCVAVLRGHTDTVNSIAFAPLEDEAAGGGGRGAGRGG